MDKLSELVDGNTFSGLTANDQNKYERQDDGTYKLTGDPTPSDDVGANLPLFVNEKELAEVDEPIRKYYEKLEDGRFQLRGFEDVHALKNAIGRIKVERDLLKTEAGKFDGFDAGELERLKEVEAKVKKESELARTDFDKQFTDASEQYKNEIQVRDTRITKLSTDLEKALIDNEATRHIADADGTPDLLLPHVRDVAEIREVNGHHRAVIIGDDGSPRLKVGATKANDFLPLSDYIDELKERPHFAGAFRGSGASGGGATNTKGDVSGDAPATVSRNDLKGIGIHSKSIAKGTTKVV